MNSELLINSKEYWEERFGSGDWDLYDGEKQSVFFSELAVSSLPTWLSAQLLRNSWKVTDFGCAAGAGTAILARLFPRCTFTGVDFSESAIVKAQKNYPYCNFVCEDMTNSLDNTDVVFCSNVLEHMKDPYTQLERLVSSAKHHAIIMVPLHDSLNISEHFFVFNEEFFPVKIGKYGLSFFKIIDCEWKNTPYWPGEQLLLVYSNTELYPDETHALAELSSNAEYMQMKGMMKEIQRELVAANLQISSLNEQNQQLIASLDNERQRIQSLQVEKDSSIQDLYVAQDMLRAEKAAAVQALESEKAASARALEAAQELLRAEKASAAQALEAEKAAHARILEQEQALSAQDLEKEKELAAKVLEKERASFTEALNVAQEMLENEKAYSEQALREEKEAAEKMLAKTKATLEAEKSEIAAILKNKELKTAWISEQLHNLNAQLEKVTAEKVALANELNLRIAGLEAEQVSRDQRISELNNQTCQLIQHTNMLVAQRKIGRAHV